MGDEKASKGGSPILRHEAHEREWAPPAEGTGMEEIERHFQRFFGEAETS